MKASYKLIWKDSARKELKSLPKKQIALILAKINALSQNPFPQGIKKLVDSDNYRIKSGVYRIIYSVFRKLLTIEIVRVKHRKDVYR